MLLTKRKSQILDMLKDTNAIRVSDLVAHFRVAPATIRRDIADLEANGLLVRTKGEVHRIPNSNAAFVPSILERNTINMVAKNAIAARAAEFISDGMTVLLDSGSTTLALARRLTNRRLTIVTNSLEVAYVLAKSPATVISCGGVFNGSHMCYLGPDAEKFISGIEVDAAFIAATGVRGAMGLTTSSPYQYNFKRTIVDVAKKRYALFDTSKFSSANLYLFTDFSNIDTAIVNRPEPGSDAEHALDSIRDQGVEIVFA